MAGKRYRSIYIHRETKSKSKSGSTIYVNHVQQYYQRVDSASCIRHVSSMVWTL
jgi:hypothetical protein